jgi:hypothetical protein
VYSENALNTFDAGRQKHIVFPLRDVSGTVMQNAYVVGIEEAANNDFQDLVYIIRNVARYVPGLTGDFNADNSVDAADYVVWRKNLGQPIGLPNETLTPGMVTQEDYATWRASFGATAAAAGAELPLAPVAAQAAISATTSVSPWEAKAAAFASLEDSARCLPPFRAGHTSARSSRPIVARLLHPHFEHHSLHNLDLYFQSLQRRRDCRVNELETDTDSTADWPQAANPMDGLSSPLLPRASSTRLRS